MRNIRKNRRAKQKAYETIKSLIMSAKLGPGQAVTETALSESLGFSRTPIREALHDLEQEGLIVTKNRRKRVYMLTVREIEDIFDLKIEIESAVARWAAQRGSEDQFNKLDKISSQMKRLARLRPGDERKEDAWLSKWLAADRRLHELLFAMAKNRRAEQIIRNFNSQWHQLKLGMLTLEGRVERSAIEHDRIVQAVRTRQPAKAQQQMRSHLQNLKKELVKIMKLANYPAN
ncbi:MAG: GntR family transcriptional regulator [Phycisphaerales bacterium]|nr:MAG: GntR family transcriptional regulator [Phycisphaerales bacterium]